MGLRSSPTAQRARRGAGTGGPASAGEGDGLRIAMSALDGGRLGISAVATGVAQAALDERSYARERRQFGQRIVDFQGVVVPARRHGHRGRGGPRRSTSSAARKRDAAAVPTQAAMAKLFATDTAMKVTTDAIQVLGGYGYTEDFPVERYMREVKVMQIFEGTNQIQRLVISRALAAGD